MFAAGAAQADAPAYAGPDTFERTDFLSANLLFRTSKYTTIALEYVYGQRRNTGIASRHNNQVLLGFQLF